LFLYVHGVFIKLNVNLSRCLFAVKTSSNVVQNNVFLANTCATPWMTAVTDPTKLDALHQHVTQNQNSVVNPAAIVYRCNGVAMATMIVQINRTRRNVRRRLVHRISFNVTPQDVYQVDGFAINRMIVGMGRMRRVECDQNRVSRTNLHVKMDHV